MKTKILVWSWWLLVFIGGGGYLWYHEINPIVWIQEQFRTQSVYIPIIWPLDPSTYSCNQCNTDSDCDNTYGCANGVCLPKRNNTCNVDSDCFGSGAYMSIQNEIFVNRRPGYNGGVLAKNPTNASYPIQCNIYAHGKTCDNGSLFNIGNEICSCGNNTFEPTAGEECDGGDNCSDICQCEGGFVPGTNGTCVPNPTLTYVSNNPTECNGNGSIEIQGIGSLGNGAGTITIGSVTVPYQMNNGTLYASNIPPGQYRGYDIAPTPCQGCNNQPIGLALQEGSPPTFTIEAFPCPECPVITPVLDPVSCAGEMRYYYEPVAGYSAGRFDENGNELISGWAITIDSAQTYNFWFQITNDGGVCNYYPELTITDDQLLTDPSCCGNGEIEGDEECDGGDNCSDTCELIVPEDYQCGECTTSADCATGMECFDSVCFPSIYQACETNSDCYSGTVSHLQPIVIHPLNSTWEPQYYPYFLGRLQITQAKPETYLTCANNIDAGKKVCTVNTRRFDYGIIGNQDICACEEGFEPDENGLCVPIPSGCPDLVPTRKSIPGCSGYVEVSFASQPGYTVPSWNSPDDALLSQGRSIVVSEPGLFSYNFHILAPSGVDVCTYEGEIDIAQSEFILDPNCPLCGNGEIEGDEECDGGDNCSDTCECKDGFFPDAYGNCGPPDPVPLICYSCDTTTNQCVGKVISGSTCPSGTYKDITQCQQNCKSNPPVTTTCYACDTATNQCVGKVISGSTCPSGTYKDITQCQQNCVPNPPVTTTCYACDTATNQCVGKVISGSTCPSGTYKDITQCQQNCVPNPPVTTTCYACDTATNQCVGKVISGSTCPSGTYKDINQCQQNCKSNPPTACAPINVNITKAGRLTCTVKTLEISVSNLNPNWMYYREKITNPVQSISKGSNSTITITSPGTYKVTVDQGTANCNAISETIYIINDCTQAICGNNVQEIGEECDGNDGLLPGEECTSTCFKRCPRNTTYCPQTNSCTTAKSCPDTPPCNNDGVCTENEDCRCSDCGGKQDSCQNNLLCKTPPSYTVVHEDMICDVISTSSISFGGSVPASFSPTHQSAPAPVKSEIIKKAGVVLNNSAEHGSPEHGAPFIIDAFPLILPKTGSNLFVYVLLGLGLVSMYGVVFHYYRKKDKTL